MISYIRGTLIEKNPAFLIVEAHGIGYKILITLSSFNALGNIGEEICLLTYLHLREDSIRLYGFISKEEREIFKMILSVSGIGPKLAQSMLSGIPYEEFKQAVYNRDIDTLTSAPGIGKKTAERLVLELRPKINQIVDETTGKAAASIPAHRDAVLALISLGFSETHANKEVEKVCEEDPSVSVEQIIRKALTK
ncbi:MAG: Holliday junction branch migration protein RuvA [bacterium]|jgi:Holliday junction DNA helicase RuvA